MKLGNDDFDDLNKSKSFAVAAVIAISTIVLIVLVVLLANKNAIKRRYSNSDVSKKVTSVQDAFTISDSKEEEEEPIFKSNSNLTASDLDFYDLYKDDEESEEVAEDEKKEDVKEEKKEDDYATDGHHTLVVNRDGTFDWVTISPNLTKHEYNFENLIDSSGKMKYFVNNKPASTWGVDISKDQGYIDFNKLKKAGVDFVMIRVGARGYQSGQITIDDYYSDNIKRATDAGLYVGLIFISAATTELEAIEEANSVIEAIGDHRITYPVAYVMQFNGNDTARYEALSKNDKTIVARAFLNTIKEANLIPMVYGDKEWLIKEIDLSKIISEFDIWLSQPDEDVPDYPYKFAMWQYEDLGTVDGISGYVNFDISFIDYSLK
ncbi:MAG: hypothetical protein IK068_00890 [Lachnospiraceae bacterium]|nr:hypothetical protein [Lachnospiraceae bacterium]